MPRYIIKLYETRIATFSRVDAEIHTVENSFTITVEDDDNSGIGNGGRSPTRPSNEQGDPPTIVDVSSPDHLDLIGETFLFNSYRLADYGDYNWKALTPLIGGQLDRNLVAFSDGSDPEVGERFTVVSILRPNGSGRLVRTEFGELVPEGSLVEARDVNFCFTRGTLIRTERGEVPVEQLKVGQRVLTLDNGLQAIRWIRKRSLSGPDLRNRANLQPIRIAKGSLGPGLPERDLWVSRQHRLLLANDLVRTHLNEAQVLVGACKLIDLSGVQPRKLRAVEYWHLMCDRHEVIFANSLPAETLFLAPKVARDLPINIATSLSPPLGEKKGAEGGFVEPARPFVDRRGPLRPILADAQSTPLIKI